MGNVDYKELKNKCFIEQVQKDMFSLRLRIVGGVVGLNELKKVYEIAEKYAKGYVHLTSRQSIEIPFIKLDDIDEVKRELLESGIQTSVCGPGVRTVTACQGSAVCKWGLIDTTRLAIEIDRRYYGHKLPHKLKIGATGCRNNCLKAESNDIGIKGGMMPKYSKENCTYCGACEMVCGSNAITVDKVNKTLEFNEKNCIMCGKCVQTCKTMAFEGENGYILFFGGLFGNRIAIGKQLIPILFSEEQVYAIIDVTLSFFETHGKPKERFCTTLDRVGWALLKKALDEALNEMK